MQTEREALLEDVEDTLKTIRLATGGGVYLELYADQLMLMVFRKMLVEVRRGLPVEWVGKQIDFVRDRMQVCRRHLTPIHDVRDVLTQFPERIRHRRLVQEDSESEESDESSIPELIDYM